MSTPTKSESPVADQHQAEPISLRRRFLSPQTAISFIVLGGLVVLLVARFDIAWSETWRLMRSMDPLWYVAAFFVHYTTFFFRGARWRMLLENAAHSEGLTIERRSTFYYGRLLLISWFANSVTFFRMGDAYRAYSYSDDTKTSFSAAAGTVLADRVVDLAVVGVLMGFGLLLLLFGGQIDPPLILVALALGLMGLIVAGLLTMTVARRWVMPRAPERISSIYERFHTGTMGSFSRLHWVFGLGVLGWLSEVGRLFCITLALGVVVAPGLIVFTPMANGLLSAIPLTPGGLGIVETGVSGILQLQLSVELAIAVALLDRTISYLSTIVTGGTLFAARQIAKAKAA
jgi:uncharacterized protein (TIRG00374 family)